MKSYSEFYRLKLIKENFEEDEDDFDEEPIEYAPGSGLLDYGDDEGYSPNKSDIEFTSSDVSEGELVPELCDNFDANILAQSIGLKTLKYFPKEKVGGNINVSENFLTSLQYSPHYITGDFECYANYITSLEGSPRSIDGEFDCSYNLLTDLIGFPSYVGRDINLSYNAKLTSLKGLEDLEYAYRIDLNNCSNLTNLKYLPKTIDILSIDNTKITNLRDLVGINVGGFNTDDEQISNIETDFYFAVLKDSMEDENYDQLFVDYLIDKIQKNNIDKEEISKLDINLDNISEKSKNVFLSLKNINKFNL